MQTLVSLTDTRNDARGIAQMIRVGLYRATQIVLDRDGFRLQQLTVGQ
jgi:hypothetical protein